MATLFCLISLTMAVLASRMSNTPETDLGVVATTATKEEAISNTVPDLPVVIESADPSDVPSMESVIAQPEVEPNAGDVPVIESEFESVPASDGSDEDTSGKDGT